MKQEERHQLATILSSVDENFLVALANKGLVRRAQKDLEAGGLSVEESDESLTVKGPDWTVWMPPSGPTHASDDTKASGVTRQILSAIIYLRDHWAPSVLAGAPAEVLAEEPDGNEVANERDASEAAEDEASKVTRKEAASESANHEATKDSDRAIVSEAPEAPRDSRILPITAPVIGNFKDNSRSESEASAGSHLIEQSVLALTLDDLQKWAGKKLVADVIAVMPPDVQLQVETKIGLTLRLIQHDVEIRVLPGKLTGARLLESMLSTAPKALHKRWVVMAVLALGQKHGVEFGSAKQRQLETVDSPVNRQQVLSSAAQLLTNMLSSGIAHPSTRQVERLFTLSISAQSVQLPRLSHSLKSLSEGVSLLLERDAAADTEKLLSTITWTYCLTKAIEAAGANVPLELTGTVRSNYSPAGSVSLAGVAAYPWQTASGFEGLTVLFWNAAQKRFFTWSTSRPSRSAIGFDVDQIYRSEPTWSGGGPPQALTRSFFLLKNARVNPSGRLSTGKESSVDISSRVTQSELDFGDRLFRNWSSLRTYATSQFPIGLQVHDPLDRIVVLQPVSWSDRYFDEMQQTFVWPIVDDSSNVLLLTLAWNSTNERAIEFLESFKPGVERVNRIVARMTLAEGGFKFEPLSFLSPSSPRGEVVLNPHFDHKLIESKQSGLLAKLRQKFGRDRIATQMTADDEWEELLHGDLSQPLVPPGIRNILSETEALILRVAESGTQQLNERIQSSFSELAVKSSRCGLSELSQSLSDIPGRENVGSRLLRADYICRLHRQALTKRVVAG